MKEQRWERITSEDDPQRCQAITSRGQCRNRQIGVSKYCPAHGGNRANQEAARHSKRMYQLDRFQNRLNSLEDAPTLKSLTTELGLLKLLFEKIFNDSAEADELAMRSPIFSKLMSEIESCSVACSNLDRYFSEFIDENEILAFVNSLMLILEPYDVSHDEIREEILESYENLRDTGTKKTPKSLIDIGTFQKELNDKVAHPKLKTLHAEIAIQRMVLEDLLRPCKDAYDLFRNAVKICNLVSHIRNMVVSCSKIDMRSGRMLNPTQMATLNASVELILMKHVTDSNDREDIGQAIIGLAEEDT